MNPIFFLFTILFFASISWLFIIIYERVPDFYTFSNDSTIFEEIPIILRWNKLSWYDAFSENLKCSKPCIFTEERELEENATVIFYHFGENKLSPVSKHFNSKRLNVMINFEPPPLGPYFTYFPPDFFNYTVSYRLDSDISMPYDCLTELNEKSNEKWSDSEVENAIEMKTDTALFLVSHCNTDSKRELVVEKMKKYMNITQYGSCNNKECGKETYCEYQEIKKHHFILAFENSVCLDYVTEKLFRFRQLIVPIILDRKVLRGIQKNLNPYVIAVSDFKSVKDMVDYLQMLMKNKDKYRKYFDWTKLYTKTNTVCLPLRGIACKLCDVAWKVKNGYRKIIPNIRHWNENNICNSSFGNFVL